MSLLSNRRRFLKISAGAAASALGILSDAVAARPLLKNPCLSPELNDASVNAWLTRVWEGLDPAQVWDCHVHLTGTGDSGKGPEMGPMLTSLWHPLLNIQRLFYLNASCSRGAAAVDDNYVARLAAQVQNMPSGFKAMLLAFDWFCDASGNPVPKQSTFYIPNDYARTVAAANPALFEWVASIHPYRPDAVDRLHEAAESGARAVKWLPSAQNIDTAAPRCEAFYAALAQLKLPLIVHGGEEKATEAKELQHLGNPLRLRRALAAGVRVVVAHCAGAGVDDDLDKPGTRQPSFALFARLMENPEWQSNLRGDISAILLRNHKTEVIKALLAREDWHDRLLNGSDYPLPGVIPLTSPRALAANGLLPEDAIAPLETLREHSALYFDFAVKRLLAWQGKSFPASVFETRQFFET